MGSSKVITYLTVRDEGRGMKREIERGGEVVGYGGGDGGGAWELVVAMAGSKKERSD